jgi:hypothetical protein
MDLLVKDEFGFITGNSSIKFLHYNFYFRIEIFVYNFFYYYFFNLSKKI